MTEHPTELAPFDGVSRVVADPLKFKLKLAIGEDAYTSLRMKKHLGDLWEVGGATATGAAVAASPVVASTLFASTATGGILGIIGLGTAAATPIGWVVAAALASGGAYYGVVSLARKYSGSRVDTIPKFINTPLDLLGASLFDLIGGLSAKLAWIDGHVDEAEKEIIASHFVGEWGLDADYVSRALDVLVAVADTLRIKQLAGAVAQFVAENPDCNAAIMRSEILRLLREVAEADDLLDEREELALDAVANIFAAEAAITPAKVRDQIADALSSTADAVSSTATAIGIQLKSGSAILKRSLPPKLGL